jgi:DNA replication protein DnaC
MEAIEVIGSLKELYKHKQENTQFNDDQIKTHIELQEKEIKAKTLEKQIEAIIPVEFREKCFISESQLDWLYGKNAYIYGTTGTGKTQLLYNIVKKHLELEQHVRFIKFVRFMNELRYSDEKLSIIKGYAEKGVLFIDDIGAENTTEFVREALYELIDTRWERHLITVISSNCTLEELATRVDDRVASRIAGMSDIILKLERKTDARTDNLKNKHKTITIL